MAGTSDRAQDREGALETLLRHVIRVVREQRPAGAGPERAREWGRGLARSDGGAALLLERVPELAPELYRRALKVPGQVGQDLRDALRFLERELRDRSPKPDSDDRLVARDPRFESGSPSLRRIWLEDTIRVGFDEIED